jgi:alkylation response protein AidB-like acyl-CoA dehydrogenase
LIKMPQDSSLEAAGRIDDWWSLAKHDISTDPFGRMARAGFFQIGLPGAGAALDTYRAIAAAEQAIAAKTGLLGLASAFAARQMTARFFVAGFADQDQRATWLPRIAAGEACVAIGISEPEVGAHPNLLAQVQPGDDAIRALAAFDLLSSVARQPRKVRQIRLGNSVWSGKQ